jgi:hypothetical protein
MQDLLRQLQQLPDDWGLVAVGANKRAYMDAWQRTPLSKAAVAAEIRAGNALAVGVLCGPISGGLLFVDHDGISATQKLEELGLPLRELPKSPCVTSGKDGRFQVIYRVPEQYWSAMRGQRVFKTGKTDANGKAEQLDLRWSGHQSIVIGAHPETSGYYWLPHRNPAEQPIADAPLGLIELLLRDPEPEPAPLLRIQPVVGRGDPLPLLDFVSRETRDLVETGGSPGSWNDDQLKMALDLVGVEAWIQQQGYGTDITAREAFAQHVAAAKVQARDFSERKAWTRFDGALKRDPQPSTPAAKLQQRLGYHTRPRREPGVSRPASTATGEPQPSAAHTPAPQLGKLSKLDAHELLLVLRERAQDQQAIRWNTFSQQIEINGSTFENAEHFYLDLADQGFKVGKELALDCLVKVAREHPYDPVRMYLEHVAATVAPAYIGGLASFYLRPDERGTTEPTLYDHMLKATLIGAVRRVFEPGCKHDTALVLVGDQGARKSSFWSALGGAFYSASLGDISDKDDLLKLHRSWIMEWAELDHITGRKHAGQVKSFLSQGTDLFRIPYGKAVEEFPRRGIIVGSTNRATGFLQDDTGNRRFLVIPTTCTEVNPIDTPTLLAERDAILSGAVHAYRAGDLNYLPAELAAKVSEENEAYQLEHPWAAPIREWLAKPGTAVDPITTERALKEAVERPTERQTRADQMAVADILRAEGLEKKRVRHKDGLLWAWGRPQAG